MGMIIQRILQNQALVSGALGWFIAQALKTLIDLFLNRSLNPERMWGSGGMPSSHSSTVCALATASLLRYGVESFEFAISFLFGIVVMHDAMGVRRETGKQAQVLNKLLFEDFLNLDGEILTKKLKEYVGHSPLQVACGAVLGIIIGIVVNGFYVQ